MKMLVAVACVLSVAACVSNPGVVPDGADGYRISAVGSTGFTSSGKMSSEVYRQATEFCAAKGQVVETIAADSKQARPMGGYPEANLRFRCVDRAQ